MKNREKSHGKVMEFVRVATLEDIVKTHIVINIIFTINKLQLINNNIDIGKLQTKL